MTARHAAEDRAGRPQCLLALAFGGGALLQGEWWRTLGVWIARLLASPMMLAWETLLVQAQANRDVAQALRDVAQANRVVAEAMLLAMREARGSHDKPCQDDELQAWFHDAQGAAAIAQASMDSAE